MKSMTGYGRAVSESGALRIEVEIRTVNGRLFKFSAKIPQELNAYEAAIKKRIANKITRGSVYVSLVYEDNSTATNLVNRELLFRYYKEMQEIATALSSQPPALDALLNLPGVLEPALSIITEGKWLQVQDVLDKALAKVEHMRKEEGAALSSEIVQYCKEIEQYTENLATLAPKIALNYHERLKQRLLDLSNQENFQYSQDDILREVAIFSDRIDISEEISRLQSHTRQFVEFAATDQAVGKTLEFLLQEIVRESNTISAKSNNADCSKIVVSIKAAVEKIREQLQNIE